MNNNFDSLHIDVVSNKNNICLNDVFSLNICIKNNYDMEIENGLFRIVLDESLFKIIDDKYKVCLNDFGYIGNIPPNNEINFDIPIEVVYTDQTKSTNITTMLNFHVVKDGKLVDLNCKSSPIVINFEESNILTTDEFIVSSSKSMYSIDEDIDFSIKVENIGSYTLNNIKITDHIPQNTYFIENSIRSNRLDKLIITGDELILTDIDSCEEVEIYYKVSISKNINDLEMHLNPKLSYIDKNLKNIEIISNSIYLLLDNKSLFSETDFEYTIDKYDVFEDDIINHTILLKNNTNTIVSNLLLNLNSSCDINFIKNTLVVNDIYRVGENINDPIILGELDPNEEINITFSTNVSTQFKNVSSCFKIEYDTNRRSIHQYSNSQEYNLLSPLFNKSSFIKSMDKGKYYLGDTCETFIEIINSGNFHASNVVLKDTYCKGLEFIQGSLFIDGIRSNIDIFNDGLHLEKLEPNKKVIISYKCKAIDIYNEKSTNATMIYSLKGDDNYLNLNSNPFKFSVIGAKIGNNDIKKILSSYSAQIGDIITTKIFIENTGNIDCESLKIFENSNSALEFIEGSLYINNKEIVNENIFNGISISNIKPKENILISYQFKVLDFPRPNPIIDKTTLSYSFMINNKLCSNTIYSSKSKVYVNNPELSIIDTNAMLKDNTYSKICHFLDNLYFSLVLENTGNIGLEDINLHLHLPEELILNIESVKINGCNYGKSFNNSIKLPNLNVSQKIYIDFFAKHNLSQTYELETLFSFDYTFKDLKTLLPYKRNVKFKENILIINADIEIDQFILNQDIEIDKEFTKNINLKNSGNIDLYDINIILNESEFLKESESTIFINGSYIPREDAIAIEKLEVNETINIAIRYYINNIPLCESTILESEVIANYYLFDNKPIPIKRKSNKIKLNVKNYNLEIKGKSSSEILMLDEIYQYTFSIINNGNIDCDLLKIDINMPNCFEYIDNSLYINNNNSNISKIDLPISIGVLNCNEILHLNFSFKVKDIPFNGVSSISSLLYGRYQTLDKTIKKTFKSNETILNIENVSLDVVKSVSHDYLQANDILQIQTILYNMGTVSIKDIILKDNEDNNLVFIENSVHIDGENIEDITPVSGIKISSLEASENILITYEYEYIPKRCSNKVTHFSDINYTYTKKDKTNQRASIKSNPIYIEGALSTFKQFGIENEYFLKDYEPDIHDIINTFTDAKVDNFYEINSIKSKSYDNTNATGRKVIVKGFVMNRIEYLIESEQSSLYMLERTQPFTIFITLPDDYEGENLYFKAKCDDAFFKTISERGIFISNLISIEGLL